MWGGKLKPAVGIIGIVMQRRLRQGSRDLRCKALEDIKA